MTHLRRRPATRSSAVKWLVYLGIIAFVLWSAWAVRVSPERIVGAGGIGVTLLNSFERYEYDFTLAIIIVIIAVVIVGEIVSELIRRRVQ